MKFKEITLTSPSVAAQTPPGESKSHFMLRGGREDQWLDSLAVMALLMVLGLRCWEA